MHGLSPARSTTAAPSRPRLRQASRLSPPHLLAGDGAWNARGRFPRSLLSGRRVRHPALPLRHRHGYAAGNSPWPPGPDNGDPARSSPPVMKGGCAPRTSPYPPGWSWRHVKRRNAAGSSRIPSRLAHRARPIRQYRAGATLSRLLPPSPATPGSGCLQLHPTAATARRWTVSHLHPKQQRLVAHPSSYHTARHRSPSHRAAYTVIPSGVSITVRPPGPARFTPLTTFPPGRPRAPDRRRSGPREPAARLARRPPWPAPADAGCGFFVGIMEAARSRPGMAMPSRLRVYAGERAFSRSPDAWSGAGSNRRPSAFQAAWRVQVSPSQAG